MQAGDDSEYIKRCVIVEAPITEKADIMYMQISCNMQIFKEYQTENVSITPDLSSTQRGREIRFVICSEIKSS